jgi:hypothetical protein
MTIKKYKLSFDSCCIRIVFAEMENDEDVNDDGGYKHSQPENASNRDYDCYKIWIKRDIPYRYPSCEYLQTVEQDRCRLRQCVNIMLPMHAWTPEEQKQITKQVKQLVNHCWKRRDMQAKSELKIVSSISKHPVICYAVGGSWMKGMCMCVYVCVWNVVWSRMK